MKIAMTMQYAKEVMARVCPEMLSNQSFIEHAVSRYCNGLFTDVKKLSKDEYAAWLKLHEAICTATVGLLISFLKSSFKPTDKLCYMDCVEGYKNDCTYVSKSLLGERFFYYAEKLQHKDTEDFSKEFPYVNRNDVVVA